MILLDARPRRPVASLLAASSALGWACGPAAAVSAPILTAWALCTAVAALDPGEPQLPHAGQSCLG
jgi:hypothetical protein